MLNLFKKALLTPKQTEKYPLSEDATPKRSRGALEIAPTCNLCQQCVKACPSGAISCKGGQLDIDYGLCLFCGKCVAFCPSKAMRHTTMFQLAQNKREDLIAPLGKPSSISAALNGKINTTFGRSLHLRHLDSGSCNACDWEIGSLLNPVHDLQRLGIDVVASPRHADLLLVTGAVSRNLEEAVLLTYDAVPKPQLVMAVGACAIDGGIFKDSYAVLKGTAQVIPVDIFVPGCPPRPEALIFGLFKLLDKYKK